jgi:hypothetical protein
LRPHGSRRTRYARAPHHEDEYADAVFKQQISFRLHGCSRCSPCRQPHSSRAVSRGRKVEGRERCETQRSSLAAPLSRSLSSRSALLRRSSHKAPGPRFRDPADFFRSPLDPFGTELLKRRRFFLRTGVLHSSHRRQRLIVAADGYPKPPQIAAANRDRRRRPFPATRTPREAPSMETTIRNIVLVSGESQEKDFPSWPAKTRP